MSVPVVQRHGEPDWETRPTADLPGVIDEPPCSGLSYEELRLQYWNSMYEREALLSCNDSAKNPRQPTDVVPKPVHPSPLFGYGSSAMLISGPNSTITVIVGQRSDQSTWHIHRKLLIAKSQFFKAALSGNFEESKTDTVHLVEEENEIFSFIVLWLYSTLGDRTGCLLPPELHHSDTLTLVKLYCIADKLKMDSLKHCVFSYLYMSHPFWRNLTPECVDYAWQRSIAGDPLIELLLDGVAYRVGRSLIKLKATLCASDTDRTIASQWRDLFDCGGEIVVEVVDRFAARSATPTLQPIDFYLGSSNLSSI